MRDESRKAFPEIAQLADDEQLLLEAGLNIAGRDQALVPWQEVVVLASAQLLDTLRSCWELAFAGYAIQSQSLARYAFEWMLLARYVEKHRDQAQPWLDAVETTPKKAGALAQDLFADDEEANASVRALHTMLHRFAHLDPIGLASVAHEGNRRQLVYGSRLDEGRLLGAAYVLLILGIVCLEPLETAGARRSDRWVQDLARVRRELDDWLATAERELEVRASTNGASASDHAKGPDVNGEGATPDG